MTAVDIPDASPGRLAEGPSGMGRQDWKDILWRLYAEFNDDRLSLIAAGATFYLLLALFPALAAFVSIYGFVADPVTIADHIAFLGGVLPSGGIDLIRTQLESLARQNEAALSFGFVIGLVVALWSANSGVKTLFEALNVAYEETEKRSFVKLNLLSFVFTIGAIAIGILFIVSVGVVPAVLAFVGGSGAQELLVSLLRWPLLLIVSAAAISVLYRYGPSRERAKWRWVTWGSAIAAFLWLIASVLFSWYLANFADYNATYGSLGAVIGFMLWTWISVLILLLGAELNSELEHQTARDSTTGAPRPMGMRGAAMADTLGGSRRTRPDNAADASAPSDRPRPAGDGDAGEDPYRGRPGSIAALAIPVVALGVGLGLGMLDRRRAGRLHRRAEPPSRAPEAASLADRMREVVNRSDLRDRLAHAGRTALAFAEREALARLSALVGRK